MGTVTLNGAGSSDPDGDTLTYAWTGPFGTVTGVSPTVTLALGQHTITLVVDDGHGATATDTVVVTVTDQSAPVISSATASPNILWPPNHTMKPVTIGVVAADNCDAAPVCRIVGVTSSEAQNGRGDGNTSPDSAITGSLTLNVRAERSGNGSGRTCTRPRWRAWTSAATGRPRRCSSPSRRARASEVTAGYKPSSARISLPCWSREGDIARGVPSRSGMIPGACGTGTRPISG